MREVFLLRAKSDSKQTLGALVASDVSQVFVCRSLELPWLGNANNVSCIPEGSYTCRWTRSNRLSSPGNDVFTYEILHVAGRAGIRIHSANFFSQLKGCIALGEAHKDINMDSELDVIHSGDTVASFVNLMERKDFILTIKSL